METTAPLHHSKSLTVLNAGDHFILEQLILHVNVITLAQEFAVIFLPTGAS